MIGRWLIFLLISAEAYTQTYTGTRFQAMGDTGVALQEIYSLTANPAGLTRLDGVVIHLAHRQHFLSTEITGQTALLGIPTAWGNFGLLASRYGLQDAYEEFQGGFVFAKPFGPKWAFALRFNLHQLRIPKYVADRTFSVDAGLQYLVRESLIIGLYYRNVGAMTYGELYGTLPSTLGIGTSYQLGNVLVTSDAVYDRIKTIAGRVGLEYALAPVFVLRGGISLNPLQQHAGFGVAWERMTIDAAATFHQRLGTAPQIGISYAF